MKNLIYLFIVLLIVAVSCSDDFTTVPAVGALSEENLANETGVDLLLTGAYSILNGCLLYTSPSPRDLSTSRMPSSA